MQNGRPLSPRAQDSSAHIESNIRAVPERSFANVDLSNDQLSSNESNRTHGWQANFNEPINQPIDLPQISRSARNTNSIITNQPTSTRWQGTLGSAGESNTHHSLSNHPRLASEHIPPIVPPRPKNTLSSKSRITAMPTSNRISPSANRPTNMSHSSGPGRGHIGGGGTLISQSQNINLPSVSPPPIPTAPISNTSNSTPLNISPITNLSQTHSQNTLSSMAHVPVNISLITPRPGPDRVQNLYVDAPLKSTVIANNQQNDLLTGSRTSIHGINSSPSPVSTSNSSVNLTSSSTCTTVTLPKCRKGHLTDQFDTLSSINCSKMGSSTNHNSHHRSHHHRHHHSHANHHSHQQKSQTLSSKLHSSVILQQPTNHSLLQSSPSAVDSKSSTLKKSFDLIEEDSKISPVLGSDLCRKCCKFQHPGTSGHLICPNHNSSSRLSEHNNSGRFFEAPLPRPTSTLPTLPINSTIRSDQDSIICRECGKCRCEACRAPRKLPEYWLCGNACVCSSETVVDTLSCMCCVKTMFYHCGKDCYVDESTVEDSTNAFDRPCSCTGQHACARWSFMGVLGMVLPCLWCYLPLKGCAKVTQSIYQRCTATGCRCEDSTQNLESPSGNVAPVLPPKMSESFVGSKSAPLPGPKSASSLSTVGNNSIRDNSSITSSPTIPSLSSPADSEKRLLD